jgi:hypothetical protein
MGDGPGEYRSPGTVIVHPDGRVLVSDTRSILVYARDGAPVAQWDAVRSTTNFGSQIYANPAGVVHVVTAVRRADAVFSRTSTIAQLFRGIVVRLRSDGSVIDTVAAPAEVFPRTARMERVDVPFVPRYLWAVSPLGYMVTSYTASYAIDLRIPRQGLPAGEGAQHEWRAGDPVVSIRRSAPVVPVQDAERADWRRSIEMFMRSTSAGGDLNWQWSGPEIPRVKPAVSALVISDDGRIWARLHQPAVLDRAVQIPSAPTTHPDSSTPGTERAGRRWAEPVLFDIFEPGGQYVGQISVPSSVSVRAIRGDTVWGVVTDATGVQTVKRYRASWGG